MITSTLREFENNPNEKDEDLVDYICNYCFNEIQIAIDGILANLSVPGLSWFFKYFLQTWSKFNNLEFSFDDECMFFY